MGYAYFWRDPKNGLEILNLALKKKRSPLGLAIRADVRISTAEDQSDLAEAVAEAELGVKDILKAKDEVPDNPFVLSISVMMHLLAANLYYEYNQVKNEAYLEVAKTDVQALKQWATLPYPAYALWFYYRDDEKQQLEYARLASESENSTAPGPQVRYALALCRSGQFNLAYNELKSRKWIEGDGDRLLTYVRAELTTKDNTVDIGEDIKSIEEIHNRNLSQSSKDFDFRQTEFYCRTLCLLGEKEKAVSFYSDALSRVDPKVDEEWWSTLDFGRRGFSEELLKIPGGRWFQFRSINQVAHFRLSVGDRNGARESFEKAKRLMIYPTFDAELVRLYLLRMEQDPNWPSWIPVKE